MSTNVKTYSELVSIPSYLGRYHYLRIKGAVGAETFGYDRYLNQILYRSSEWRRFRRGIILRDNGMDMAFDGYEIFTRLIVHHIDPITVDDVLNRDPKVFNPENVVCVAFQTHQAIHYGDESLLPILPPERTPNDTCPWKR